MFDDNDKYNADELVAPNWLNEEFFEEILRKEFLEKDLKVTQLTLTPGTTKSDHYASTMFRAKIHYTLQPNERKTKSFIIKTTPVQESEKKDLLEKSSIFETEIRMYNDSLPKIKSILQKYGDNTNFCAKIFYHSLKPHNCIVFEDLRELGYITISKRACNMEEAKVAFLNLAKMHAVSYKLAQEGDNSITAYNDGSFSNTKVLEVNYIKDSLSTFKGIITKYDELRPYVKQIEKIEGNLFQRVIESFSSYNNGKRDGIFVLCHGDFHVKNLMLKEKAGKLDDLKLVDFQLCVFASPAIDLLYAFTMLFSAEMREKHRDELFYYYFTNFQETLRKIDFKGRVPTVLDFQKELLNHIHWELLLAIAFLLFNYVFTEDGDLGRAIEDKEFCLKMWQNPKIIQELKVLLPRLMYRGAFEEQ